ncbi:MAG: hypothetical protein ACPLPV_04150, partial [Methanomassiliicoccales archaeon]
DILPGNPYSYCKNNPVSMVDPSGWMYMYRAAVLGGDNGTWADAIRYLCGAAVDAAGYLLRPGNNDLRLELVCLLANRPWIMDQWGDYLVQLAMLFLGVDVSDWTISSFRDSHLQSRDFVCIDFVSLILRLSGLVENTFNPSPEEALAVYTERFQESGTYYESGLIAIFSTENAEIGHAAFQIFDVQSGRRLYIGIGPNGCIGQWSPEDFTNPKLYPFPRLFMPWISPY